MAMDVSIAPLRIADEAFMVLSTIERCPRQMMLRELVMNALEAAAQASGSQRNVRIDAVNIEGAPKLRIWNTGRGLSQAELLQISDLSSSLFKTVSLDGNFGMGAKAASLASNKHGLRYRSCHRGRVSQIVLGARDGVYGRVLQVDPAGSARREAIDVTAASRALGETLSHDWTEVTLFGNAPEQNTAADPYAGDPPLPRDWVIQTLGRRFMRLPQGVELAIEPSASGAAAREIFTPPLAASSFERIEAVEVENGVVIHYGYRSKDSKLPPPRVNVVGVGAVVYDGEVYALTDDRRWALEAPTYGFSFAAKQCSVIVELPHGFGARPEQYRQFLRFNDGDQHQVQLADFGDLVRRNLPGWLKRIIAAQMPAESDYLAEIRDEMRHLLAELGIEDLLRAPQAPKPKPPEAQTPSSAQKPPPQPKPSEAPSPPEIITVEDEADIVEKALGGRAARYYPAARQVFVNARYGAFARMQAQLAEEFAPFADEEAIRRLAKLTSEWAIIQRIARSLLHSIGKPKSGWSPDEIRTVQSPETMSLMVDDIDPLLAPARRRMAAQLGLEPETSGQGGLGGDPLAQRAAGELADAEARLQRAKASDAPRLGPLYQQIGAIHMRQRNLAAARAWLEKGMAVDAKDPWCRHEYAGLLLAENDLDRAAEVADEALALAPENTVTFHRRRAEIEIRRGNIAGAEARLTEVAAQDPQSPWPHFDLAGLYLREGKLDEATQAAETAIERSPVPAPDLLRRRADIELRRGDRDAARRLLEQARAINPRDPWTHHQIARLEMAEGRHDDAARALDDALALRTPVDAMLHRARSELEMQRGQPAAALVSAQRAVSADPADPAVHVQLTGVLQAIGDFDAAAEAAAEAARLAPSPAPHIRRQAEIESLRGRPAQALELFDRAAALTPHDPWTWLSVSTQRLKLNDLDGADEAARRSEALMPTTAKSYALRRRAQIAAKRNDVPAALGFLQEAMAVAPQDPAIRLDAAHHLLEAGDAEAALDRVKEAIALSSTPQPAMFRRAAAIEERRGDWEAAQGYLRQAIAAEPGQAGHWSALANFFTRTGDLSGAREAAEQAVRVASGEQETLRKAKPAA